jgi:hypothetical protein
MKQNIKTALLSACRIAIVTAGLVVALIGFTLLFIPMLGIVLMCAGSAIVALGNRTASWQREAAPRDAAETVRIPVEQPVGVPLPARAFGIAMARALVVFRNREEMFAGRPSAQSG